VCGAIAPPCPQGCSVCCLRVTARPTSMHSGFMATDLPQQPEAAREDRMDRVSADGSVARMGNQDVCREKSTNRDLRPPVRLAPHRAMRRALMLGARGHRSGAMSPSYLPTSGPWRERRTGGK
jgi:hypothetical protein